MRWVCWLLEVSSVNIFSLSLYFFPNYQMLDDFDAMTLEPTGSLAEQQAIQQMQQASILQQLQAEQGADQVMATMVQQDQWAMQQQQQLQQQFLIEQQQLLMEQQQLLYEQQMGFTDSNHPHQQS